MFGSFRIEARIINIGLDLPDYGIRNSVALVIFYFLIECSGVIKKLLFGGVETGRLEVKHDADSFQDEYGGVTRDSYGGQTMQVSCVNTFDTSFC